MNVTCQICRAPQFAPHVSRVCLPLLHAAAATARDGIAWEGVALEAQGRDGELREEDGPPGALEGAQVLGVDGEAPEAVGHRVDARAEQDAAEATRLQAGIWQAGVCDGMHTEGGKLPWSRCEGRLSADRVQGGVVRAEREACRRHLTCALLSSPSTSDE
eukprot:3836227-Prymnesium_polylepis.1